MPRFFTPIPGAGGLHSDHGRQDRALDRFGLGARRGEARNVPTLEGGCSHSWKAARLRHTHRNVRPRHRRSDTPRFAWRARRSAAATARRRRLVDVATAEAIAAFDQRVTTDRPFVERLVMFWSNDLCVVRRRKDSGGATRGQLRARGDPAARAWTVRGHGARLGEASRDARLSRQFPVDRSELAGSATVRRPRGPRGLNENYARELLELHTLSVDGGYTQQDVQELARTLTGWTVSGLAGRGQAARMAAGRGRQRTPADATTDAAIGFGFQDALHEPGTERCSACNTETTASHKASA